jgi:hypothetical protein
MLAHPCINRTITPHRRGIFGQYLSIIRDYEKLCHRSLYILRSEKAEPVISMRATSTSIRNDDLAQSIPGEKKELAGPHQYVKKV